MIKQPDHFPYILATASTRCTGDQNRIDNICLATHYIDGTILKPFDIFSYRRLCGPYTSAKGYKQALAYCNGKNVYAEGGGICQLSSTLYLATLIANLETVERHAHQFNVGYLPIVGTDATVSASGADFKFRNTYDSPIKIISYMETKENDRLVTVSIRGKKPIIYIGKPYSIILSTTEPRFIYEPSYLVPRGQGPIEDKSRTGFRGIIVEVHNKLLDSNDNAISDTIIHIDEYQVRDTYFLYNPLSKIPK